MMSQTLIESFLKKHQLPADYLLAVNDWFFPVVEKLLAEQQALKKPLIIGINGTQGSGKTTLTDLFHTVFEEQYQLKVASLSIDDFYLTRQERACLADTVHPLMATRGVPGTHDIDLAMQTIAQLLQTDKETLIPRFDKANDDRCNESEWTSVTGPVDVIIFEGWCLGARPQSLEQLSTTVNDLEENEDSDLVWRYYVNQQLQDSYLQLFNLIDKWIMLKAPSFDCVYNWRLEQEQKLRSSISDPQMTMDDLAIARFVKFYQRITQHLLKTLPDKVDFLFELNSQRQVTKLLKK